MSRRAARIAASAAVVLVAIAGVIALLAFFSSRDASQVAVPEGPGMLEPGLGSAHRSGAGGASPGRPAARPPTSGPHRPRLPAADERSVSDDELLSLLEVGDVVIAYPQAKPPAALRRLQDGLTGRYDRTLAAAGQAVALVRRPALDGIQALAWRHRLTAPSAADPRLEEFAQAWLGRGAPDHG